MDNKISILYIGESPESEEIIRHFQSSQEIELIVHPHLLAVNNYLANHAKPDAIFSEYDLIGGNGIEFHDEIRKDKSFDGVAYILLVHEFTEELFKKSFYKRIDDFYVLPLPPVEGLVNRVRFLKEFRMKQPVSSPVVVPALEYKMPRTKRVFDIVVAGTALLLLSPLLLLVMIAIRLESKGKVFYTSKRVGREKFDFYKFRSMRTGADKELNKLAKENNQYASAQKRTQIDYTAPCPECEKRKDGNPCKDEKGNAEWKYYGENKRICEVWYNTQKREIAIYKKISKDPRVTKVGKFIRNTSIDELPQLINVLKGDMSIVGNRPLPEDEADKLRTDDMTKRFHAPAGITGLWQVELRGKGGDMSQEERSNLDSIYADHFEGDNYSFFYDLNLIRRTFKALFQKDSV
jgi:lipopolysaccharide/colanic/teichoic acid biosynthesis glycosyltransferase